MVTNKGELWSFFRALISQGTYIQMDYAAGKYKCYEEFSARLDAAARERLEEFQRKQAPQQPICPPSPVIKCAYCEATFSTAAATDAHILTCSARSTPETRPAPDPQPPPPATTFKADPNGECEHCGLSFLLHIIVDEHGRKDVCMAGYSAARTIHE